MSSYAQKHPHQPKCTVITCDEVGTAILFLHGKLGWFCPDHSELAEKEK